MKTFRILLGLMMLVVSLASYSHNVRDSIEESYLSQIHVREATGYNDGADVVKYLNSTGLPQGYAWCAAFVSWNYEQCSVQTPLKAQAWSPSWFPSNRVCYDINTGGTTPQKGDVFGIYYKQKKRIAHVGFIHRWPPDKDYCITVEGNTNKAGSREGDGVYCKRRLKRQVYKVSNWVGSLHATTSQPMSNQYYYPNTKARNYA